MAQIKVKDSALHFFICALLIGLNYQLRDYDLYWGIVPMVPIVLLAVVPILALSLIFQNSWLDLGFGRPQNLRALKFIGPVILLLSPPVIWFGIRSTDAESYYRELFTLETSIADQFFQLGSFLIISVFVMEFFFRSFFLLGARKLRYLSPKLAIILVLIGEVVLHSYKPTPEMLGMVILSPVLSWTAIQTRSLWPAVVLHIWIEMTLLAALYVPAVAG